MVATRVRSGGCSACARARVLAGPCPCDRVCEDRPGLEPVRDWAGPSGEVPTRRGYAGNGRSSLVSSLPAPEPGARSQEDTEDWWETSTRLAEGERGWGGAVSQGQAREARVRVCVQLLCRRRRKSSSCGDKND